MKFEFSSPVLDYYEVLKWDILFVFSYPLCKHLDMKFTHQSIVKCLIFVGNIRPDHKFVVSWPHSVATNPHQVSMSWTSLEFASGLHM